MEGGANAGEEQEVVCTANGSHPAANISWSLDGRPNWMPLQLNEVSTTFTCQKECWLALRKYIFPGIR